MKAKLDVGEFSSPEEVEQRQKEIVIDIAERQEKIKQKIRSRNSNFFLL